MATPRHTAPRLRASRSKEPSIGEGLICIHGCKPRTGNGNDMVGETKCSCQTEPVLFMWPTEVELSISWHFHTIHFHGIPLAPKQSKHIDMCHQWHSYTRRKRYPILPCAANPLLACDTSWPVATWAPMSSRSLPCRFPYRGRQLSSSKRTHCWRTCLGWYMPRLWYESNGGSNLQPFEGHRRPPTPRRGVFKHIQLKHRKQIPSFDRKANETSCGWSP